MIESATVFTTCSDARYRNIGDEGIVVRQTAGEVLVLNEVGVRVLDLVASGTSVGALLETLSAEYDVEPGVLEDDVRAYLQELLDARIIESAQT